MATHLVWFGNNLRVKDNQILREACKAERVIAVYFFDPRHFEKNDFGFKKTERFRAKFLIESVLALKENLANLNISLLTFTAKPEDKIPELIETFHIDGVFYQEEWTSEEMTVINEVKARAPKACSFVSFFDQFLFHPEDIPYTSFTDIPNVFTTFRKKCEAKVQVRPIISIPAPKAKQNLVDDPTSLPSLKDLGLKEFSPDYRSAFPFHGGESAAEKRIQEYFWETEQLVFYKRTRNGLVGKDYSSKLSAWLANGSISARTIYWEVKQFEKEVTKNQDTYWLIFELIWRDYFKYVSLKFGNQIFQLGGILNREYKWKTDNAKTLEWIHGNTPDDFVNANMLELKHTGWMSNRGRQNVASYWSKYLQQDWRIGASYFESMLMDYDVHSNWGNWMYNSGVGNDPRNRTFNTQRQANMYDPNKRFQKIWLQPTLF
ncbi:DASH family cryptochrome [Flagellimonas zhangzhouensis]|nr:DASH family cryptochrome [Allomuricauda zhangzhouensis]